MSNYDPYPDKWTPPKPIDPIENALNVWRENTLDSEDLPAHVQTQIDLIARNVPIKSVPGSMVDMTVQELNDVIGAAFRAGWDHAEMYWQMRNKSRPVVMESKDAQYIVGADGIPYGPFPKN